MMSPHLSVVLGFLFISRILADDYLNVWSYESGGDADQKIYEAVNTWRGSRKLPPVVQMGKKFVDQLSSLGGVLTPKMKIIGDGSEGYTISSISAFMNKIVDMGKEVAKDKLPKTCPESISVEGYPIHGDGLFSTFPSVSASLVKRKESVEEGADFIKALSENKNAATGTVTEDPRFNFLLPVHGLNMVCSKKAVTCSTNTISGGSMTRIESNKPGFSEGTYDFCLFYTSYDLMSKGDDSKYLLNSVTALMKGESPASPPWTTSGVLSFQPGRGLVVMYLLVFLSVYVLV